MATNDMIRDRVGDLALERRDTIDMNVHRVTAPLDRVRWGAVFAGLFTTISTFILLSVLGAAIGASTFDPGDNLNGLGASAGIWGAVTALIAFFVGGLIAARAAAVTGKGNGALNGVMVWIVMIPLALYMVSSGIGTTLGALGGIAATGIEAAAPIVGQVADNAVAPADVTVEGIQATAEAAGETLSAPNAQATLDASVQAVLPDVNEQQVDQAVEATAWGTLVALVLGMVASLLGGLVGGRSRTRDQVVAIA